MRRGQRRMQAQRAARVRIKIVEHDGAIGLAVDKDAGTDATALCDQLAPGFIVMVVFDHQRRVAATGRGAETFQEMDGHGYAYARETKEEAQA